MVLVLKKASENYEVLLAAAQNSPALVIDCANCANPHSLYPLVDQKMLSQVYVIEIEMIYKFRQALSRALAMPQFKTVAITSFSRLFSYSNEQENRDVIAHCWEIIRELSRTRQVIVAAG